MRTKTRQGWTTLLLLGAFGAESLASSLTPLQTYTVGSASSQNARWFPGGKQALLAVENTLVVIGDGGKALQTLRGPVRNIQELAIRPDGTQVVGLASGELFVWQLPEGRLLQRLEVPRAEVELAQYRADGKLLLRVTGLPKLQLLEVGQTRLQATGVPSGYFMVSPDGKSLLHYEFSRETATLLDAATFQSLSPARVIKEVGSVAVSADSRRFVVTNNLDKSGVLTVFGAGQPVRAITASLQSASVTFVGPDEVLTTSLSDGEERRAQIVNVQTGKVQASVPVKGSSFSLESNQSGRLIFTGSGQAQLAQWTGAGWNTPRALVFPAGRVDAVGFDGSQPVALLAGKALRLGQSGGPVPGKLGKDLAESVLRIGSVAAADDSTRKALARLTLPEGASSTAVTVNPAGKAALGINLGVSGTGEIWIYPRGSVTPVLKIKAAGAPLVLAFSPDGRWLAASTNSRDTGVQVFNVASGAEVAHSAPLNVFAGGLAWNADGGRLLVGRGLVSKESSVTLLQFRP